MTVASPATAPELTLDRVLSRAGDYVSKFYDQLSGIVAEETYRQMARSFRVSSSPVDLRKTLQSDLLLVRPADGDRYVEFRDVFAVDGRQVRDRQDRLMKLFLAPDASIDQMRAIIAESARHNIGDIPRNINTPMLTLYFLQPRNQQRFKFKRAKSSVPELADSSAVAHTNDAVFRTTTEVWTIEFRETDKPTVIKTNRGRDFPASGRFWIEPDTGAVRMSELVMANGDVSANIVVSYQSEPLLGFLVPVEMRERYRSRSERVEGAATYGKFRQFLVKTGETIGKPPGQQ